MKTYNYSLAPQRTDEFGCSRDKFVRDLEADEFATLEIGDFESAIDLPDGVEFARGVDAAGNSVRVYRQL